MSNSNNLGFAYLEASQAQKHVTVNEALRLLDALVNLIIVDRNLTVPPGSPVEGDVYIPANSSTDDWASHDLELAFYADSAWQFVAPKNGWRAWIQDEDQFVYWSTDASPDNWIDVPGGGGTSIAVDKNGVLVGTRGTLNLIEGTNITLTVTDDTVDAEVDITIDGVDVSALTSTATASADSLLFYDSDGAVHIRRPVSDFLSDQNVLTTADEGTGNGLDADTVDGLEAAAFAELAASSNTFTGNLVVQGDLTISGSTTTVDTANLAVSDNIIICNNDVTGSPTEDAGLEIERGTETNAQILWNETADEWQAGLAGSLNTIVLQADADAAYADQTISITAGTALSGGGDISANRTLDLDISGLGAVTAIVGADSVLAYDASGTVHIRRTFTDVLSDLSILTTASVVDAATLDGIDSSAFALLASADFTTLQKGGANVLTTANEGSGNGLDADTVDGIEGAALVQTTRALGAGNGLSGGGTLGADRSFDLALQELSLDTGTVLESADWLTFVDATDNAHYRISIANFITDQNIVLSTDSIDADTVDGIDGSALVQTTRALGAGIGLSGGGTLGADRSFDLALQELSLDTGTVLESADWLTFVDATDNTHYRISIANFITDQNIVLSTDNIDADTLDGVDSSAFAQLASANFTTLQRGGADVLTTANEGAGNGLDADTVDGKQASAFSELAAASNTFTGNMVVQGNLTISGATTTVDTANLLVSDNIIVCNNDVIGSPTENAGLEIERGTDTNAQVLWNETADEWQAGLGGALETIVLQSDADAAYAAQSITITAGLGLTGGGDISANRTLDLDISGLGAATAVVGADSVLIYDASGATHIRRSWDNVIGDLNLLSSNTEDQTITGGASVTIKDQGTKSAGSYTMDFGDRPVQKLSNGGAFTLAPPSADGTCILHITNNASAGAITTSGWSLVDGDVFSTTNLDEFICSCIRANGSSILTVKAL